jgi:hypothetical protein
MEAFTPDPIYVSPTLFRRLELLGITHYQGLPIVVSERLELASVTDAWSRMESGQRSRSLMECLELDEVLQRPTVSALIAYLSKLDPDSLIVIRDADTQALIHIFHFSAVGSRVVIYGEYEEMLSRL